MNYDSNLLKNQAYMEVLEATQAILGLVSPSLSPGKVYSHYDRAISISLWLHKTEIKYKYKYNILIFTSVALLSIHSNVLPSIHSNDVKTAKFAIKRLG